MDMFKERTKEPAKVEDGHGVALSIFRRNSSRLTEGH